MAVWTFTLTAVYAASSGSLVRTVFKQSGTVTRLDGSAVPPITQAGSVVPRVTTDGNGSAQFTVDRTAWGTSAPEVLVTFGTHSVQVKADEYGDYLASVANGASATSIDSHLGGDASGLLDGSGNVVGGRVPTKLDDSRAGLQSLETQRATALRTFHAALADRANNPCDILAIGDSITEGQNAGTAANRWIERLRDNLRNRYPVTGITGGEGYRPVYWNAGMSLPAPATITGSIGVQSNYGFGKVSGATNSTSNYVTFTVTGTAVDILYLGSTTSGTMSVSVDGGAATNYSTVKGSPTDSGVQRVTFGARGTHTVKIGWASGGYVLPEGVMIYDGDELAGIRMTGSGHYGWNASHWITNTGGQLDRLGERITTLSPDLVIIALGANAITAGTAPATVRSNVETLIAKIRAVMTTDPSIVVAGHLARAGSYTYTWDDYRAAFRDLEAADTGVAFFDLAARVPDYATANALGMMADTVHPNAKGHAYIADALAGFLSPR